MSPKYMPTSASSPATRRSAVFNRLRIPATTSGLGANTRTRDVTKRLVLAMRRRSEEAWLKLSLTLQDLLLESLKRPMKEKKAPRNIRPKVDWGRENWVFVVPMEAASLHFSSATECGGRTFSSDLCSRKARARAKEMEGTVTMDPGLSSLYTTDSINMTSFPISSTRGKNESTIESRIPWAIQAGYRWHENGAPLEMAYWHT
jgi:hypothetical protein